MFIIIIGTHAKFNESRTTLNIFRASVIYEISTIKGVNEPLKINLSKDTIQSLEDASGKKISRNGDEVVQQVCDQALQNCGKKGTAWVEPDILEKEEQNENP